MAAINEFFYTFFHSIRMFFNLRMHRDSVKAPVLPAKDLYPAKLRPTLPNTK